MTNTKHIGLTTRTSVSVDREVHSRFVEINKSRGMKINYVLDSIIDEWIRKNSEIKEVK